MKMIRLMAAMMALILFITAIGTNYTMPVAATAVDDISTAGIEKILTDDQDVTKNTGTPDNPDAIDLNDNKDNTDDDENTDEPDEETPDTEKTLGTEEENNTDDPDEDIDGEIGSDDEDESLEEPDEEFEDFEEFEEIQMVFFSAFIINLDYGINYSDWDEEFVRVVKAHDVKYEGDFFHTTDVEELDVLDANNEGIKDLTGIEHFTGLEHLNVGNNKLKRLDLSENINLQSLYCYYNKIEELILPDSAELRYINMYNNRVTALDTSNYPNLTRLDADRNRLTALDVSNNNSLETLIISQNPISQTGLILNSNINYLNLSHTKIENFTGILSSVPNLEGFSYHGAGFYTGNVQNDYGKRYGPDSIDFSVTPNITRLIVNNLYNCDITGIDSLSELYWLEFNNNEKGVNLDFSANDKLEILELRDNGLLALDVGALTSLRVLDVRDNYLSELDLSSNINLRWLDAGNNRLNSVTLSDENPSPYFFIDLSENNMDDVNDIVNGGGLSWYEPDDRYSWHEIDWDYPGNHDRKSFIFNPQRFSGGFIGFSEFECPNFIAALKENISYDDVRGFSKDEVEDREYLHLCWKGITDLSGIEFFSGLERLYVNHNSLTSIDISQNDNLIEFEANYQGNQDDHENPNDWLSEVIGLDELTGLERIGLGGNSMPKITDFSQYTNLKHLNYEEQGISTINFYSNNVLEELYLGANNFTSLNISAFNNMRILSIWNNPISQDGLILNTGLKELNIGGTKITDINSHLAMLPELESFDYGGPREYYDGLESLDFTYNPELINLMANWLQLDEIKGIDDLNKLRSINIADSPAVASKLNMAKYPELHSLNLEHNRLTGVFDISSLENLEHVDLRHNRLSGVKLNAASDYQYINVDDNRIIEKSHVEGKYISWNEDNFVWGRQMSGEDAAKAEKAEALQEAIDKSSGTKEAPALITLTEDIDIFNEIIISRNKHVRLTSDSTIRTLKRDSGYDYNIIQVENGASLVLENIIVDGNNSGRDRLINVFGTLEMKNGAVLRNNTGGGVEVGYGARFEMTGGVISGNTAIEGEGGGVRLYDNAEFIMSGGTISGNAAISGGGVAITNHSTFNMSGNALIEKNIARYDPNHTSNWVSGGGVRVTEHSTFNMSGNAVIRDNETITYTGDGGSGGGVELSDFSTFNMSGGTISGNRTAGWGGGVVSDDSTINISGGIISGNNADDSGGGIHSGNSITNISGGSVINNTARLGGGVNIERRRAWFTDITPDGIVFTMSGGNISGNTATFNDNGGSGVRVYGAEFIMSGGLINDNRATVGKNNAVVIGSSDGGWIEFPASFVMTGGVIYGKGNGIDDVVYLCTINPARGTFDFNNTSGALNNGIVIAWNGAGTSYTEGSGTDLIINPANSAEWLRPNHISYRNGTNAGTIAVSGVTVNERRTEASPSPSPRPSPSPGPTPTPSPTPDLTPPPADDIPVVIEEQVIFEILLVQEDPVIELSDVDGTVITEDTLQAIAESGNDVEVVLEDGFSFTILADSITTDARAFDLDIDISLTSEATDIDGVNIPANAIVISPNFSGEFGFGIRFTFTADQLTAAGVDGNNVRLFHVDSNGVVTDLGRASLNPDGSVSFIIDSASYYVLSESAPIGIRYIAPRTYDDSTPQPNAWPLITALIILSLLGITKGRLR